MYRHSGKGGNGTQYTVKLFWNCKGISVFSVIVRKTAIRKMEAADQLVKRYVNKEQLRSWRLSLLATSKS